MVPHTAILAEGTEGSQSLRARIKQEGDILSVRAEVKVRIVDVVASESEGQLVEVRGELGSGKGE